MDKRNKFFVALAEAFKQCTGNDFRKIENLMQSSGSRNYAGESNWNSLQYKPFYFWRVIAYFVARGSGNYNIDEVVKEITVWDKCGENFINRFKVSEVLNWCNKNGVFAVKWGPSQPPVSVESVSVEVDVSPLYWKWNFESEEVEHEAKL